MDGIGKSKAAFVVATTVVPAAKVAPPSVDVFTWICCELVPGQK
jgi:hypothetical protein